LLWNSKVFFWYGPGPQYTALVIELLGPTLEELFKHCDRKFTMKTVLMIANQMISVVECLHSKNFIHRDITPNNFVMGLGKKNNQLYLIDFGLSKRFKDKRKGNHLSFHEDDRKIYGNHRYASLNASLGKEHSRRDDIESIGYILMYFIKGKLPWQGLDASTKKQKVRNVIETKRMVSIEYLCKGFPSEFTSYLKYCRGLTFEEAPDYQYLRNLFSTLLTDLNYHHDIVFDWNHKPHQ